VLTPLTITPFALPLALLGIPPLIYIVVASLSTLYQFWIHTELIGRLGPLEKVLNTPSHHRVHHARNPGYLDRNYGAVLIVWDRLFGTYAPERERPQYGITKPLRSFNALWAQVQPLAELTAISRAAPTWRDRLSVWLAPPERSFSWHPEAPSTTGSGGSARYDVAVSAPVRRYVLVNFALAIVATFLLMLWSNSLPLHVRAASAAVVLLTVLTAGGLLEGQRWARPLELLRLASVAPVFAWAWLSIG
jgi:alkylglycerol monooxygenase